MSLKEKEQFRLAQAQIGELEDELTKIHRERDEQLNRIESKLDQLISGGVNVTVSEGVTTSTTTDSKPTRKRRSTAKKTDTFIPKIDTSNMKSSKKTTTKKTTTKVDLDTSALDGLKE